ncbi:MAG: hypothetical protein HXK97_02450 [Candidatus Nanogingivalaceae bacterium]|nr:hypothetical protein [Candidatus Nanogingivalaceae bacterium]
MLTQKKTPHQRIRITLVGLAALLVVPVLMTFFALSPTANAARARLDHSPYLAQVKQLLLARAMHGCIVGSAGFDGNLTSAKVASGDWGGVITTTVGPILDGDDDGLFDCKQVVSAARNAFGYGSFTDMFCALKGEWRDNANLDCTSNITKGEYSGDKWNIPRDRGVYAIQVLEKKAGKSLKFDSALVNYSMAMAALLSGQKIGCKAEWRGYDSGDDAASNDIKADQRNKKIAVALADGTVAYGYYYIPDANKSVPLFSGAGAPYTAPGGIDTKMSCERIAQWASNNAEAAAKSAKTEATENTRRAIYDALLKKCIEKSGGGVGGAAEHICRQQVDSWMNTCKDKIPSSGAVASSEEYVTCIATASGYNKNEISGALSGISADPPSGQSGGDEKKPECAVKDLGWLICPVVNFLSDISDAAFAMIADNFLKIEPDLASGGEVQAAWGIMRNIANGAFIIMFLAIIISQLTGFGISNYGIKKMLPRLIVAAILVNVSIYICQIAVDLSNILGYGLRAGIGGIGDEITRANEIFQSGQGRGTWGGFALTVLAAGTAGILALAVLIGALVSGLVVMATIAVLLIARKALIVILIVISPLAFVAFLLPNTEKFFSKWRSIFVGLLMVFPTIGLLFGGGILAGAIVKAGGGNDMIMQIVGELIKVLPLIAVWSVLKKAIDVAGSISQHINNAGGRLGGGAKNWAKDTYDNSRLGEMQKFRKQRRQRRKALMRAGAWKGDGFMDQLWRNRKSQLSKRFNESALANNRFLGGDYGIRSAAEGQDAVDDEERKTAERMLDYRYNGDAAAALRDAGDNEVLKHIAFKKLESTGKHGAEQMYEYLQGGGTISNRRMAETLTRMKDEHAGLFEMGRTAIDQMEQDGATSVSFSQQQMAELTAKGVNGLSDEKLARQVSSAVKVAGETEFTKGGQKMVGISPERAGSLLDNKRVNTSISGSTRKALENIRNSDRAAEPQELRVPHDMSGVSAADVKNTINATTEINNITEAVPSDTPMGRTFVAGTGRGPAPPQSPPSAPPNNQNNRNNRNNNPPAAS